MDDLFNLFGKPRKNDPLSLERLMAGDSINIGFDWGTLVENHGRAPRRSNIRRPRMPARRTQAPRKDQQKYQVAFGQNGVDRRVGFSNRIEAMRYYNKLRASDNYDDVIIRGK